MAGNEPLVKVAPEFFVPDVAAAVSFYVDNLGFTVLRQEPVFAVIALDDAHILIAADSIAAHALPPPPESRGRALNIRIMVDDVDDLYRRAKAADAAIVHDIGSRDYGLRDFIMADPNGFMLRFAAPLAG